MSAAPDRTGRITLPSPEQMTPEQRAVHARIVNGPRGVMVGPLRAVIHSPELADRWQMLGEYCRYNTSLPPVLTELAILVTARRWSSELEWTIHRRIGEAEGLDPQLVEAIRTGQPPIFDEPAQAEVHAFARALQMTGDVDDVTYGAVKARWGERGVVELTAVIGYYTMVAMMLNTHRIPLPNPDDADLWPGSNPGLAELPAAKGATR